MSKPFDAYSAYYSLLYRDKQYNKEVDYLHKILGQYGNGGRSLLELGSGTGGHGLLLQDLGYSVLGLELSPKMVEQALIKGFPCRVTDITDFDLGIQFDSVVSLFHVISYLTSNQQLQAVIQNVHRHLKPDGVFIFDVWYAPAVLSQKPESRQKTAEDEFVHIVRYAEPVMHWSRNVVDVKYRVVVINKEDGKSTEIHEIHPMRYFSVPEVDMLATANGFQLIKYEEFGSGLEASDKTWGVCFILKKR